MPDKPASRQSKILVGCVLLALELVLFFMVCALGITNSGIVALLMAGWASYAMLQALRTALILIDVILDK